MKETNKKFKNYKKVQKNKVKISRPEFEKLLKGLTDEELNQVSCWLSARQRKL